MTMARPLQNPIITGTCRGSGVGWVGGGARRAAALDETTHRQHRDEAVEAQEPDDEHEDAGAHHRREEELDRRAVRAGRRRRRQEGGDHRGEGAGGAVDHAGPPAEEAADQPDDPRGVQRDGRSHVRHQRERDRLGDLREADDDAEHRLAQDDRRRHRRLRIARGAAGVRVETREARSRTVVAGRRRAARLGGGRVDAGAWWHRERRGGARLQGRVLL